MQRAILAVSVRLVSVSAMILQAQGSHLLKDNIQTICRFYKADVFDDIVMLNGISMSPHYVDNHCSCLHEGFSGDRFRPIQCQLKAFIGTSTSTGQLTSIIRSSLFGTSTSLICLTATASPVPQLKALYTDPKAPFPMQSPSR